MKLRVVHDASGRIVAAAEVIEGDEATPSATPLPGPHETAAEVEVPAEVASETLDVICTRMRVDTENNRLTAADA
ncbi:MAG: hypothetical protein QOK00_1562 [Thermoleophilaceae bacterium]|jgi:hypothetical protein|nr:hypothetical protein [Thermoleophilaceae bacterium]MEA2401159.1 hypothetical protein [Thermoleophilaceae bacterium]MEA2454228.1 hypothetical protein [Thermoleophilaceae bacterium]